MGLGAYKDWCGEKLTDNLLQHETIRDTFDQSVVEVTWTGFSTWKALEYDSVTSNCSTWRIQDFHLVWRAGTHDHSLGHHPSHLSRLQVAKQDGHTVLHLYRNQRRTFTALSRKRTESSHLRVLVYLVQRYVLDQSTDHSPGRGLAHIHLLHVQTVGVRVLLGFDYSSHAQIQAGHIHLGLILAWGGLFLLCFISSLRRRKERQPGSGCVKSIFYILKENWK